ncbi:MAG TPA: hypothetical protein PKD99_02070 [Sphingopyxis sp.]|nr:hypothetical protein [Sphingopyxis sp.]HMP43864.1 hypothetical protein [Sphingopyxis sp.]HMQ20068.1 hypothetical protein [Sphingopyxis sp.]
MTESPAGEPQVRAIRDALKAALVELDRLGESAAAIELNSAIEILNARLGETTPDAEIAQLQRHYFAD